MIYDNYKSGDSELKMEIREIKDEIHELSERLTKLEFIVSGADGQNGLRSNMKKMLEEMESLKRILWIAVGIGIVIQILVPAIIRNIHP